MAPTTCVETVAHACARLQASPRAVREALRAIGAEPLLVVNDLQHFSEDDVQRAAARLQQNKPEAGR